MGTVQGGWATRGVALIVAMLLAGCTNGRPAAPVEVVVEVGRAVLPGGTLERPNIVLVTTDDQTRYDLRWMPLTRSLLADAGMEFTQAISPHPLCCPARAELLTGQYAHNNGVRHNHGEYGGFPALDSSSTLATWLEGEGYQTAFFGKYLNEYELTRPRQPGWTVWDALMARVYDFESYGLWNNEPDQPAYFEGSYLTDVLAERSEQTVRDFAADDEPFFVWVSNVAPHDANQGEGWGPPVPAARHGDVLGGIRPPSLGRPSFNVEEEGVRTGAGRESDAATAERVTDLFRQRIRSLQAVDEAVASMVATLADTGELENTWIFFASDNGYSLGEHGHVGKDTLHRESLSIPLLVKGPGVDPGSRSSRRVTLVDLPVTIADLAGVEPGLEVDGQSFAGVLRGEPGPWRDTQLIQTGSPSSRGRNPGWAWRGVLAGPWVYGLHMNTGEQLLYDHRTDPFEMQNLAADPAYADVLAELERRAAILRDCHGADCSQRFGQVEGETGPVPPRPVGYLSPGGVRR